MVIFCWLRCVLPSCALLLSVFFLSCLSVTADAQEDPAANAIVADSPVATAQPASAGTPLLPALTVTTNDQGGQDYSVTLQVLALMTVLTLLPSFLLMMTSFTRIIIVFAILRQAIGLNTTPSNQILLGLALFLTLFIMSPVFTKINDEAVQPYMNEQLTSMEAATKASKPIHSFMVAQTRESDLNLFMKISNTAAVETAEDIPFLVLAPAFLTSELKTAFQIGFILFIPFLVIDLVVASVLMAMGMMMLSPLIVSLPFKIMLFVLVDGWAMVVSSLAASYGV